MGPKTKPAILNGALTYSLFLVNSLSKNPFFSVLEAIL
jgi:hypothetical protein